MDDEDTKRRYGQLRIDERPGGWSRSDEDSERWREFEDSVRRLAERTLGKWEIRIQPRSKLLN